MPTTKAKRSRARNQARSHAAAAAVPDSSWMTAAACTHRPDLPWIGDLETTTASARLAMAAVCAGCPVVAACDRFATDQDMTGGFWAGAPRDLDASGMLTGPGWTINPLPGLDSLGGAA